MPHDKNGRVLTEGDLVNVPARVKRIHEGDEYCNVEIETVEPMYPGDSKSNLTLNTKQVELVEKATVETAGGAPAADEKSE